MADVRFDSYTDLLATLVSRRDRTCERIERRLLNVKDKPAARLRERQYFVRLLTECFFEDLPRDAAILAERLAAARESDGFEPFPMHGSAQQLDAPELIVRAYEHWDRSRWPGAAARLRYAHTIWSVFLLRLMQELTLRIWDEGEEQAPHRLRQVQRLLDAVIAGSPACALLRDARWLLHVAQGPLTKGLAPYFRVAERIRRSFAGVDALTLHSAGAKLAGGHLRSQVRHRAAELQRPTDAPEVLAVTRNSNSMDVALLAWDLVPLLEEYADARARGDGPARAAIAEAIVQGVSADPELMLTRLDLLAPCTVVETVFLSVDDGRVGLTPTGCAHGQMLERYAALIDELAPALAEDADAVAPVPDAYSPLAIEYGFCGDLLTNMAMDTLRGAPAPDIALEDVFTPGGDTARKQSRAQFVLAPAWAQDVFARTRLALEQRSRRRGHANASSTRSASLRVSTRSEDLPADAQEYCITSDVTLALATGATAFPRGQIVADRSEGRFLASADTGGRWFGVSKMLLSERIAQGRDAVLAGVPQDVVDILRLTCGELCRSEDPGGSEDPPYLFRVNA